MATRGIECDPQDEQSALSVTTTGDDVTKTCMVEYDNTKTKMAIMDALAKCTQTVQEELSDLTD